MSVTGDGFRSRLLDPDGEVLWGIFSSIGDPTAAEICATGGFDLVVIDAEHGITDLPGIADQLRAVAAQGTAAAVRPWSDDANLLKRVLDAGATTVVVPMVESAGQAAEIVSAIRYPPAGRRGVATPRAARWGATAGYHRSADASICLIVQVETVAGLDALDDICAVDGVDAVFVGPSDLAASLGHLGEPHHPDVVAAVESAVARIAGAGCVPATLATDPEIVRRYVAAGARFVAVAVDSALLAGAVRAARRAVDPPS